MKPYPRLTNSVRGQAPDQCRQALRTDNLSYFVRLARRRPVSVLRAILRDMGGLNYN